MKEFLAHHSYLIIWILALVIIGFGAVFIFQLNGITTGSIQNPSPLLRPLPAVSGAPASTAPAVAPAPSITLTIVKSAAGNSLFVQWQNLPGNTTAINIFRGKANSSSSWELWETLNISAGAGGDGNASIALGSSLESGYSFYVEAVTNGGGGAGGDENGNGGNGSSTILWVSSSTTPIIATSTSPEPPDNGNNPPSNNESGSPSSTPSSTSPSGPPSGAGSSSPSSSNPGGDNNGSGGSNNGGTGGSGGSGSNPPQGNPYYNPQVQITGYGTAPGSFWVEYVNQSIEIGWQDLPAEVTSIVVARAQNSDGPWNTIINQQNPGTSGSYSLQLVDDALGDPYYYEMTAINGTTTVATYGPAYLAGN